MFSPISDSAKRRLRINNACSGVEPHQWISLRQGPMQVPVVHLEHELLIYRVDNGRLLSALQERLASHSERLATLQAREAEADTQDLLHALLLDKAADSRGPILRELQRLAVQTEPLLVDSTGVVINGNRRLSAMRHLFREDPRRFQRFERPLVAVLPAEVSRSDVEYIETALQLAPDTKLPYGWVDRRLKLRRQIDELGLDPAWVQQAYQLESRQQLDRELAELTLVEKYLNEHCGTPLQYSAVSSSEALFQGLQRQLETLNDALAIPWRAIGLLLIQQRSHLAPTFERQFPFEAAASNDLPRIVLQRLVDETSLLSRSGGIKGQRRLYRRIAKQVLRSREPKRLAQDVESFVEEVRRQLRQDKVPDRLLHHLQTSSRLLEKLSPGQLNKQERFQLKGEANAIQSRLKLLLNESELTTLTSARQRWWRWKRRATSFLN